MNGNDGPARDGGVFLSRVGWLAAGAFGLVLAGALTAGIVIENGLYDVTASGQHSPLLAEVIHGTFLHAVARNAKAVQAPASFSKEQVLSGFRIYTERCEACHGGPGVPRDRWVSGMNPTPPYLVDASSRFNASELYWIVSNGVKMTGMPAWGVSRPKQEIWDVVAFLKAMPSIPPGRYQEVRDRLKKAPRSAAPEPEGA